MTELEKKTFDKVNESIIKNKQIEEIAEILCRYKADDGTCIVTLRECDHTCAYTQYGETLYNAGYRKASDVAREIFEEIEREINDALQSNYKVLPLIEQSESLWNRVNGKIDALRGLEDYLAELKKKYTEGEE